MMKKKLLISFFILLIIFPFSALSIRARADDLVIGDDGKVVLVITNSGVLGVTTTTTPAKPAAPAQQSNPPQQNETHSSAPQPQHTENKQQSSPPPPAKIIPLVPPHTQSTVQINPPINNDKKVQVTVTTGTSPQMPATQTKQSSIPPVTPRPGSILKTNGIQTSTNSPSTPATAVTKTVDQVVAQGANGQPVLSIKSDKANQLTIQQGTTQVTTSLPLRMDNITHTLSVSTPTNASSPVSVLPSEAIQGILDKGLLNNNSLNNTKVSLTKDTNGVNYTVNSRKQGKLFGVFPVQSAVQVQLSAQTGKIVNTSQSLLFNVLGGFIK